MVDARLYPDLVEKYKLSRGMILIGEAMYMEKSLEELLALLR